MMTESLTIGAPAPNLPSTGGTLNIYTNGGVFFPSTGSMSTFTIKGDVNLYGASITTDPSRIGAVDVRGALPSEIPGVLNSFGTGRMDSIFADVINAGALNVGSAGGAVSALSIVGDVAVSGQVNVFQGSALFAGTLAVSGGMDMYGGTTTVGMGTAALLLSGTFQSHGGSAGQADTINVSTLTNTGTIRYVDSLHTLVLNGAYTQAGSGTLDMRISATSNDWFSIMSAATLAGTLRVTAVGTLPPATTWTLLTAAGGVAGPFTNALLPAGLVDLYTAFTVSVG
jgi:hypothetical protein